MSKPLSFGSLRSLSVLDDGDDDEERKDETTHSELKIMYDVDPSCKSLFVLFFNG